MARLARLELDEEEVDLFTEQLSQILDHASRVKELDTAGVEPTSHPVRLANVWREDTPHSPLPAETALAGAPEVEDSMFKVPRILESEEAG